jgi:hypothetical protein
MVSVKALGAIALTLVICVPIGLGYLLAVDEETVDGWQTTDQYNISDVLLNSTTDYYNSYSGPGNNSTLIQSIYYPSGGATETQQVAPAYVKIGTTYSSLPTYTTMTDSYDLYAGSSTTYTLNGASETQSVGSGTGATYAIGGFEFVVLTITSSNTSLHWTLNYDSGTTYTKNQTVAIQISDPITPAGSTTPYFTYRLFNKSLPQGYVDTTTYSVATDGDGTVTVGTRGYTQIAPSATSWSADLPAHSGICLTNPSGTTYVATDDNTLLTVTSSGTVSVGGTIVPKVTKVEVVEGLGYSEMYYSYTAPDGKYANPAYGWTIPTSGVIKSTHWLNNQLNSSARIMLSFPDGANDVSLAPTYGGTTYSALTIVRASDGTVAANGVPLGQFTQVEVDISNTGYTVAGIKAWPNVGADPVRLNTITIPATIGNFSQIDLSGTTSTVQFRVDSTIMVAGSYPSTKDYTLNCSEIYPNTAISLKINSIGVYGDSLTIGGVEYAVHDTKISVDDKLIGLKGAIIAMMPIGDSWEVTINGVPVVTTSAMPSITFGGEWSLTVMAYKLEQSTQTAAVWQPGGFAFDKESFAAAGILVAGALLVILGMTGQRSSAKMGLLMLILGGAAMVYFTII